MDRTTARAITATLRASLLGGRKLGAMVVGDHVQLQGGEEVEEIPLLGLREPELLARWDRYLEDNGVDVGRRWPTPLAIRELEARAQ